jgi:hypothetical protein
MAELKDVHQKNHLKNHPRKVLKNQAVKEDHLKK